MTQVTIHIHSETAAPLLASGPEGARHLASAVRRAVSVVQESGRNVTYAPVVLGDGRGCAMSARARGGGVVVELDAPGTLLPGRGTVVDRGIRPPSARRRP